MDARDFYTDSYIVPVFGGFGLPVANSASKTVKGGYLYFGDAYGKCSTVTYVKKFVEPM